VQTLERIAPPRLAGKWDNVGLLIDHAIPIMDAAKPFKVLLTNDLTLHVVHEAIEKNISLIVTYHPTPFSPLKKFPFTSASSPMASKVVLLCARHDIAVYSPHTSWDNVKPGLNDWLLEGICNEALKKINRKMATKVTKKGIGNTHILQNVNFSNFYAFLDLKRFLSI
jgi:putative NIF3 family GTP cyclohydrolase 1 type 2